MKGKKEKNATPWGQDAEWWKADSVKTSKRLAEKDIELEALKERVKELESRETHILNRDVRWWKNNAMATSKELDKVKRELVRYKAHVEKQDKKIKKLKKKVKK